MAALLGSIGGLASSVPGVGGILPGVPAIPTVAGAAAEGQTKVKQFFMEGFPIGRLLLFFLAGGIPVAPFSFWGYGAVNLMVAGSKGWAALKAALQMAFVLANKFLGAYYPKLWWVGWLLVLNPWYVFDIVQLFSPTFESEGFKVPFYGEQIRPEDGVYKLNGIVMGIMIGLFSLGGVSLLSYLPPQVVGAAKPTIELIFKVIGGLTAVAGGGLGAYVLLPQLLSSVKSDVGAVRTAVAVAAPAAAPGTVPAGVPAPQKGGSGQGGVIPSLREIAAGMLGPDPRGDPAPYRSGIIVGGGRSPSGSKPSTVDSALFLGILVLSALGGLSLAVVRSRETSGA
jgi:hypothetical protein